MEFEEGVNTYVDVDYADDYVENYYIDTNPLRVAYELLDDDDKEILLREATLNIDSLVLNGKKRYNEQNLQFPRSTQDEVPENVKKAQVEIMLSGLEKDTRQDLIRSGVKSYRIGDLSETLEKTNVENNKLNNSFKAEMLLKPYTSGSKNVE